MPTIDTTDWLALKAQVDTLSTLPTMPVFEPGAIVTPPGGPFILLSDVRNDTSRDGRVSPVSRRSGTLMLSVQWPLSRAVTHTQLVEIGGQIAAHFKADTCMGGLRVLEDASAMQPYVEGVYQVVTVRVFWSSV